MTIIFNYKKHHDEKPLYENILATLQNLIRTFCLEQQIKRIELSKLCTGQD